MSRLWTKAFVIFLLLAPFSLLQYGSGVTFTNAQDGEGDSIIDDESDVEIEDGKGGEEPADGPKDSTEEQQEGEEKPEDTGPLIRSSEFVETNMIFTNNDVQTLPAGSLTKCLVGFANIGELDFIVESVEGSVRYPADYNYYIQNFTRIAVNRLVKPKELSTYYYAFIPHESLASRPFGLVFIISYKDPEGTPFKTVLFNDTVTFVEKAEGVDGEAIFMYVFLAACGVLAILLIRQLIAARMSKKSSKPTFETGTQNADVNMEWIPKENLYYAGGQSPKRSPGNRKKKSKND